MSALSAELAVLTGALADPGVDLQDQLHRLAGTVGVAVSSFLGVRMTVVVDDYPFTVTALDAAAVAGPVCVPVFVGASVSFPLGSAGGATTTSTVVLYATTPGAFVDLAADVTVALGLDPGVVVIDGHLGEPDGAPVVSGSSGLSGVSIINQAVGVLLGRGRLPEQARAALDAYAAATGLEVVDAAGAVLASITLQHPDHDPNGDGGPGQGPRRQR